MTPLEMHIGVNLILQKVNSNLLSVIKPEEMDWLLNSEIIRYINQRVRPSSDPKGLGFQKDDKRYEDLKALIGTPANLPVFTRDGKSVFSITPSNCFRIVRSRSLTKDLCSSTYAPNIISQNYYYVTYKLLNTGISNYENFELKINGASIFKTIDYPQFVNGLAIPEMKFELIAFILEAIRLAGYEAKYENLGSLFYRESIIITSYTSVILTVIYNGGSPIITNPTLTTLNKVNYIGDTNEVDNVLLPTDEYNTMLNSEFGTTIPSHPIVTLESNHINIFHKQKFIVSSVSLDFIRFPRRISLPLNQSCDLDESVHEEIVGNLGDRLAAITTASNYQQLVRENMIQE